MNLSNSKIWTIISHEYLTKVKSKGFLVGTFLGPIILVAFFGIIIAINVFSIDDTSKKLGVLDRENIVASELIKLDSKKYFQVNKSIEELNNQVLNGKLDGYVVIPEDIVDKGEITVYSQGGGGTGLVVALQTNIEEIIRNKRLTQLGITKESIRFVDKPVVINTEKITKKGVEQDYTEALAFVGYLLGFAIYMLIFIYGGFVSRAVIEEKANRIIEIMISSVRPFELMIGKVIGIAFVSLTQITIWLVLLLAVLTITGSVANSILGDSANQAALIENVQKNSGMYNGVSQGITTSSVVNRGESKQQGVESQQVKVAKMLKEIPSISPFIVIGFIFYFLIGYLIYSSLFAAVGSAVDQESDVAQLQLPVTLPVIIPIMVIPQVMSNPDSTMSVVMSLIPFFTPILMTVRIAATVVPVWQIILSVILSISTFFACLWVSAKIYRIGILMTGKKPSFKDIFKWVKMD